MPSAPPGTGLAITAAAGPTCPVEKIPPDPACAPRPVAGATILIKAGAGTIVATARDRCQRHRIGRPDARHVRRRAAAGGRTDGNGRSREVAVVAGTLTPGPPRVRHRDPLVADRRRESWCGSAPRRACKAAARQASVSSAHVSIARSRARRPRPPGPGVADRPRRAADARRRSIGVARASAEPGRIGRAGRDARPDPDARADRQPEPRGDRRPGRDRRARGAREVRRPGEVAQAAARRQARQGPRGRRHAHRHRGHPDRRRRRHRVHARRRFHVHSSSTPVPRGSSAMPTRSSPTSASA